MDQGQIEIISVNDSNSADIEEPAGAAVGEPFNAHDGSREADSGSQPQNLNYTSDAQEVQAIESERFNAAKFDLLILAEAQGLDPTKINLWKVAFEEYSKAFTVNETLLYKRDEEIRSVKNEIYQVVGFFSAFQGLLITAAAQSNFLRCNNVGFILALSAFATAAAVFGIWKKVGAMEELQYAKNANKHIMKVLHWRLAHLRERGCHFDFGFLDSESHFNYSSCSLLKKILVSYGTCLVVSVIAFAGLCMVAMRQIVCNPGHSLPSN